MLTARQWALMCMLILGVVLIVQGVSVFNDDGPLPAPPAKPIPPPEFAAPPVGPAEAVADGSNFGWKPDPEAAEQFIRSMGDRAFLKQAAPQLFEGPQSDSVLLYRALYLAYEQRYPGSKWVVGKQGIGDCVSWGAKHACEVSQAVEWKLGNTDFWEVVASEPIYGGSRCEARGRDFAGWSDGSYGSAAAKWLRDWGVIYRQEYRPDTAGESILDLRSYSSSRAKDWGAYGCGGRGYWGKHLDQLAKSHPATNVALVRNFDELAAAISSGYAVSVCSDQGFSSRRREGGWAAPQGTWYHCMSFIAIRRNPDGALCLNSWGVWNSGPVWPEDQPPGSFWVERRTVDRMLGQRDSYAIGFAQGWPRRELKHGEGW